MDSEGFVWRRRVGFGDCDPAGIAYTGRIPEFALEAIDAFWEDLLDGDNWYRWVMDFGLGAPFVRLEFDFKAPITPRAPLACHVVPRALGESSLAFAVEGRQDGRTCFVSRFVCVFVDKDFRKIRAPERIRAALLAAWPDLAPTPDAEGDSPAG